MFTERWTAIAARISGIAEAATLLALFLQAKGQEPYGVQRSLGTECAQILDDLVAFGVAYSGALPNTVSARIDRFAQVHRNLFDGAKEDSTQARAAILYLTAIKSEIVYLLSDQQDLIRNRTERAFLHLQRLLAADERERERWEKAFDSKSGEVACEKLGATHLLWHGIYAFKVDGAGARSDLVLPEVPDLNNAARALEGLVLTEWKVGDSSNFKIQFETAKYQASLYSEGILSGIELARVRYLILISKHSIPSHLIPKDNEYNGAIYRHINIAIAPLTPSVQAQRKTPKQ